MELIKLSRLFTAGALLLFFAGSVHAQELGLSQQILSYTASILRVQPDQVLSQKQILATDVLDLSEKSTTLEEKRVLFILADMVEKKTLRKNIESMLEQMKTQPTPIAKRIKEVPPIYVQYAVDTLEASIEAIVKMRGMTSDSKMNHYTEWTELSEKMLLKLDQSEKGLQNVLAFSKSKSLKTESAEILVDGEASFAKREQIMREAKNAINILTWSVYDDMTGKALADLLIEKKKQNKKIQIRLIVDGQVAQQAGRNVQLNRMKEAGIELILWFSKNNSYLGQHRKMIVVDNKHLIAGGLNYGDVYSHKNPDPKVARWRDTDIYLRGAAANEGNNLFAKMWNTQLDEQKDLKFSKMLLSKSAVKSKVTDIEVSIIDHSPSEKPEGSTIMMTILKSIREARNSIDIENAYIILFPALKKELQKAITERNVKVRILTNSAQSVDEPIVSIPILRSVLEFVNMGAEVYVKKGQTLHSKLLIVDSEISMIMSYNLHPRSERIEGEMAVLVNDRAFAAELTEVFNKDISPGKAQAVKKTEDLVLPSSPVSIPTLRLFFDML